VKGKVGKPIYKKLQQKGGRGVGTEEGNRERLS